MKRKVSSAGELVSVIEYLSRIDAEMRGMMTAVVKEKHGSYWTDIAVIRFKRDGSVSCNSIEHEPTPEEEKAIALEIAEVQWPKIKPIMSIASNNPPERLAKADPAHVFEFRNNENKIVFVQLRFEAKGEKSYIPYTFWDDDEWRVAEPDGPLPLYNAEKIKNAAIVFVHEGAKAARHVQWMVEGKTRAAKDALAAHPWGKDLSAGVHVGWTGGALSPLRTDWGILKKEGIKRVYIVADNDKPGLSAIPRISKQISLPCYSIEFNSQFPGSFDLADKFPDEMFSEIDGKRHYIGNSFREHTHPATWATNEIPPPSGKGKPIVVLRESFVSQWAYCEALDIYVNTEMTNIIRNESVLNRMVYAFSDVFDTARLIVNTYQGRTVTICYNPGQNGNIVLANGDQSINCHVPSPIQAAPGDPQPFLDFMAYLFKNEKEKYEMLKWCATLIARPDVHMGYGVLLISEHQGIGKTTLGEAILAPLLGHSNVSFPSEMDITSQFNDWVAHKRLAVISEIYSGANWKAYQVLKSIITDRRISVNQKHMKLYTVDNHCHIFASSNSMRALKIEKDDRRWLCPEVTETAWTRGQFEAFRNWVATGGLSIIKQWALDFGDYVSPGDRAPATMRKDEMIENSRSEAQAEAIAIAEALLACGKPGAIIMRNVMEWCRHQTPGKVYDANEALQKSMTEVGLIGIRRVKIASRQERVVINPLLLSMAAVEMDGKSEAEQNSILNRYIRENIVTCSQLMEATI